MIQIALAVFVEPTLDLLKSEIIEKVSVLSLLLLTVRYFWKENKELKTRIQQVIDDHKSDLKVQAKDMTSMVQKYQEFADALQKALTK